MGAVYEPFLQGTSDIGVFLARWLFEGATFGEAACMSQRMLSWQITAIGDPLYRPYHKKPQVQHEELEKSKDKLFEWSLLRVVNINLDTAYPADEAIQFLRERPETKTSALLSEKLGDILKTKGKWIDAVKSYQAALALNPTPQQKLKIIFTLAPMQNNLGRGREAYELYQSVLRDYPSYPDALSLYKRLLPLAQQHGKPGEAAEYSRLIKELTPKT
jgi:tetratricopeptide (TPR) repeat protein